MICNIADAVVSFGPSLTGKLERRTADGEDSRPGKRCACVQLLQLVAANFDPNNAGYLVSLQARS